jgi:hypothetical protein
MTLFAIYKNNIPEPTTFTDSMEEAIYWLQDVKNTYLDPDYDYKFEYSFNKLYVYSMYKWYPIKYFSLEDTYNFKEVTES